MTREELVMIRLECIKIANAKSGSFGDVFAVAKQYEDYILTAGMDVGTKLNSETKKVSQSGKSAILA